MTCELTIILIIDISRWVFFTMTWFAQSSRNLSFRSINYTFFVTRSFCTLGVLSAFHIFYFMCREKNAIKIHKSHKNIHYLRKYIKRKKNRGCLRFLDNIWKMQREVFSSMKGDHDRLFLTIGIDPFVDRKKKLEQIWNFY